MMRAFVAAVTATCAACGRLEFSPLDMQTGDAGAVDDAIDSTTPYVCPNGVRLCDTFDAATLSTQWQPSANVFLDTTTWYRGGRALHFAMPPTPANTQNGVYIQNTDPWITSASQVWMRAFVRVGSLPEATNALEVLSLEQSGGMGDAVFLRMQAVEIYTQFEGRTIGTNVAPVNTWFCLVWHVTLSPNLAGTMKLTSDMLSPIEMLNATTQGTPPADLISFGPYYSASNADVAQPAMEVWMDDVIVDDVGPLTCAD
jgi:hypothetical protein